MLWFEAYFLILVRSNFFLSRLAWARYTRPLGSFLAKRYSFDQSLRVEELEGYPEFPYVGYREGLGLSLMELRLF